MLKRSSLALLTRLFHPKKPTSSLLPHRKRTSHYPMTALPTHGSLPTGVPFTSRSRGLSHSGNQNPYGSPSLTPNLYPTLDSGSSHTLPSIMTALYRPHYTALSPDYCAQPIPFSGRSASTFYKAPHLEHLRTLALTMHSIARCATVPFITQ